MKIAKWLVAAFFIFGGVALSIYALIGLLETPFEVFGRGYGSQGMDTQAALVLLLLGGAMALYGFGNFAYLGSSPKGKPDADLTGPEA
jgi:hypothetical protein